MKNIQKTTFLILSMLFLNTLLAQKISLKKQKITTQFIKLPSSNKLNNFYTYSVKLYSSQKTLKHLGIKHEKITKHLDLRGFEYTPENGDLVYSISIGKPEVVNEVITTAKSNVKQPYGTSQTVTKHIAHSKIKIPTSIKLINNVTGESLYNVTFSTINNPTTFQSAPQVSQEKAQSFLNAKSSGINIYAKDSYLKELEENIKILKLNYEYSIKSNKVLFYQIDTKKTPQLKTLYDDILTVTSAIENKIPNTSLDELRFKVMPILNKWKEAAAKLDNQSSYDKKLKFIYLYNTARVQLFLEYFDEANNTCDLIVKHGHKAFEADVIKNEINIVKARLKENGFTSRHIYRTGFSEQNRYIYDPVKVSTLDQLKIDLNNSKKEFKDTFGKKILGDTILSRESHFSTLKFTLDNIPFEYKTGKLNYGSGRRLRDYTSYHVYIGPGRLLAKEGSFESISLNLFSRENTREDLTADNIIAHLENHSNKELKHICIGPYKDSIPYVKNGVRQAPKLINWNEYTNDLAVKIQVEFVNKAHHGLTSYSTKTSDTFQIHLIEKTPIVIKTNGNNYSNGYMAKIMIPIIKLQRFWFGPYSNLYTEEYITLKNVEMYILIE